MSVGTKHRRYYQYKHNGQITDTSALWGGLLGLSLFLGDKLQEPFPRYEAVCIVTHKESVSVKCLETHREAFNKTWDRNTLDKKNFHIRSIEVSRRAPVVLMICQVVKTTKALLLTESKYKHREPSQWHDPAEQVSAFPIAISSEKPEK